MSVVAESPIASNGIIGVTDEKEESFLAIEADPKDPDEYLNTPTEEFNTKRLKPEEILPGLANEINPKIKLELIRQCSLTSVQRISEQFSIPKDLLWEWRSIFNSYGESEFLKRENTRVRFMSRKKKAIILKEVEIKGMERVSAKYGVSKSAIISWQRLMSAVGKTKFVEKGTRGWKGGKVYTREEKMGIVYEAEAHGFHNTAMKYDIAKCTLENWKNRLAHFGKEGLTQRVGSGGGNGKNLYTMEKRVEIVQYYLRHGLKATAREFGCNTPCIYAWKNKIEQLGVEGFLSGSRNWGEKGGDVGTLGAFGAKQSIHTLLEDNNKEPMKLERDSRGELLTCPDLGGFAMAGREFEGGCGPGIIKGENSADPKLWPTKKLLDAVNKKQKEGEMKGKGKGKKRRPRLKSGLEKLDNIENNTINNTINNTDTDPEPQPPTDNKEINYEYDMEMAGLALKDNMEDNMNMDMNIDMNTNINRNMNRNTHPVIASLQQMLSNGGNSSNGHQALPKVEDINTKNEEVKYKKLFKGEMKKLLPMRLYLEFKIEFKKMVQKYQFKALEVYSNYDKQ